MQLSVRKFRAADEPHWDTFVDRSWNGTFLHTRKFLSYHKGHFDDASLLIELDGKIAGVLPAAVDPSSLDRVNSHPGITYGGLVHGGQLQGQAMIAALSEVARWYKAQGFRTLRYKVVPPIYHNFPSQDDLYALFRLGGTRCGCDLAAVIDYRARRPLAGGRRNGLRKAQKMGFSIRTGATHLEELWDVLSEHLYLKFGTTPTHSLAEIKELFARFPDNIECVVSSLHGRVAAGVVLFQHPATVHLQYSVTGPQGQKGSALDLLLHHCIEAGAGRGKRYFSFGISSEKGGCTLNEGLHWFKASFGAGGAVHDFYDLPLDFAAAPETGGKTAFED